MAVIDFFVFAAGFAAAWFGKDTLTKWWLGAEGFIKGLEAKAASVKAAITPAAAPAATPPATPPAS